ncbi:hypothetical protein EYC84_006502 [Monilinia fructicola]|uniref:Uncharacterized protein n=1 Tax=Monilinia fructicola TaxID=38448 RepID=A0A5M9K7D2_MONFR|nr:hypothetical protein EYC84_006502 [Monilinia fructicola]
MRRDPHDAYAGPSESESSPFTNVGRSLWWRQYSELCWMRVIPRQFSGWERIFSALQSYLGMDRHSERS